MPFEKMETPFKKLPAHLGEQLRWVQRTCILIVQICLWREAEAGNGFKTIDLGFEVS